MDFFPAPSGLCPAETTSSSRAGTDSGGRPSDSCFLVDVWGGWKKTNDSWLPVAFLALARRFRGPGWLSS